jgi:hypothetical protein
VCIEESSCGNGEEDKGKGEGIFVFSFILVSMKSRFAKRGTKMAPAPLGEPFVELKPEKLLH